jgi:hypothetical protein
MLLGLGIYSEGKGRRSKPAREGRCARATRVAHRSSGGDVECGEQGVVCNVKCPKDADDRKEVEALGK